MRWLPAAILLLLLAPGCVVIKVGAQNPIPEMTTIAVCPFHNLSQEPTHVVDGRRFALGYYSELQKTPGFEVIPVGVVETAILKHQLDINRKEDILRLAEILNADAVVVGAVTDYHAYYPPRIGLQVDWYSPREWPLKYRGLGDEGLGDGSGDGFWGCFNPHRHHHEIHEVHEIRGQSPAEPGTSSPAEGAMPSVEQPLPEPLPMVPLDPNKPLEALPPGMPPGAVPRPLGTAQFDPTQPLMSYTRQFDGADAELVNKLRDYLEMRGDKRSGGWEAYLHRSEDFIRFTSHLMIVEMLSLHGGAVKSQVVIKWRKYR